MSPPENLPAIQKKGLARDVQRDQPVPDVVQGKAQMLQGQYLMEPDNVFIRIQPAAAFIIVNLEMKNSFYWLIKHFDGEMLDHIRSRFDKESGVAFMRRLP